MSDAPTSAVPLIELRSVTKTYFNGDLATQVLHGINLKIYSGEFLAIMGASGSGKSTLMNILGCLDRPTTGQYLFKGRDVSAFSRDELSDLRREAFGFVFQSYNLIGGGTAAENVEVPAVYAGVAPPQRHDPCPRTADAAWPRGSHRLSPEAALGRSAAARVDRARTDERRPDHPGRRAHRRARQQERRRGDEAAG